MLFQLIARRFETRSPGVIANQPFSAWKQVFPDKSMPVAAIDRLVHHATILELNVDRYRRRAAAGRQPCLRFGAIFGFDRAGGSEQRRHLPRISASIGENCAKLCEIRKEVRWYITCKIRGAGASWTRQTVSRWPMPPMWQTSCVNAPPMRRHRCAMCQSLRPGWDWPGSG
ncbi:MAG: ATP-binding protein [Roseovarius sp.]